LIVFWSASGHEEGAESRRVTVEGVVLAGLDDGGARIAYVEDEMPDFEQDRALTRELDADEVARDVDQKRLRRVDEPGEVVVAG
jgi:hypothetical protein